MRVVLGLLLLTAAGLKAHQLATVPVVGDGLLDNRWLLMAEVELELAFGLWLLAGLAPKWTWRAAVLCFAGFACITLAKALAGETTCGCFGRVEVNPWYTLVLDLAAVGALLFWRPVGTGSATSVPLRSVMLRGTPVILLWCCLGIPAIAPMSMCRSATLGENGITAGGGNLVVFEPEDWAGKRFPLLPFVEDLPNGRQAGQRPLRERMAEAEWIVVLYRPDCPSCVEAMPKYGELGRLAAEDPTLPRVALIEVPPYVTAGSSVSSRSSGCVFGRLSDGVKWFVGTPVELALDHGKITCFSEGEDGG